VHESQCKKCDKPINFIVRVRRSPVKIISNQLGYGKESFQVVFYYIKAKDMSTEK
jgi:hypothetical protein